MIGRAISAAKASTPRLPMLPPELELQVADLAAGPQRYPSLGDADGALVVAPPLPRPHAASEAALAEMEAALRPPRREVIRDWLLGIAVAVRNAPEGDALEARIAAIASVCEDLPAAVWTAEAARQACRSWQWWPAAADVDALLRPEAERLWRRRDALRRIVEAGRDPPVRGEQPPALGPAEQAEIAAGLRRLAASLVADGADDAPRRTRAAPVSEGEMLAEYERLAAAGNAAAAMRAEALRSRLAVGAGARAP